MCFFVCRYLHMHMAQRLSNPNNTSYSLFGLAVCIWESWESWFEVLARACSHRMLPPWWSSGSGPQTMHKRRKSRHFSCWKRFRSSSAMNAHGHSLKTTQVLSRLRFATLQMRWLVYSAVEVRSITKGSGQHQQSAFISYLKFHASIHVSFLFIGWLFSSTKGFFTWQVRLHDRSFNSGSVHAPSCYQLGRGWKRLLHANFSFIALRGFHFGVVILYADRQHHHGHHPQPHPSSSCITFHLLRACCWPGPFGYQYYSPVWFFVSLGRT